MAAAGMVISLPYASRRLSRVPADEAVDDDEPVADVDAPPAEAVDDVEADARDFKLPLLCVRFGEDLPKAEAWSFRSSKSEPRSLAFLRTWGLARGGGDATDCSSVAAQSGGLPATGGIATAEVACDCACTAWDVTL